ncbi:RxLR effector candidate protein, partial [Phytophthora palmivora]
EDSIALFAHPQLHRFPWSVPDSVANKHIGAAIKKQVTKRYQQEGPTIKETVQQLMEQTPKRVWILWECPCARACWQQLVSHWTGERWSEDQLAQFMRHCASWTAPKLSTYRRNRITHKNPDKEYRVHLHGTAVDTAK